MQPSEPVLRMLPSWTAWGPVLFVLPAAIGYSLLACWSCVLPALWIARRDAAAHWMDRARRIFPWRVTALCARVFIPIVVAAMARDVTGPWSRLAPTTMAWVAGACAAVSCETAFFTLERRSRPALRLNADTWLRGIAGELLIRWPHYALAIVAALAMPAAEGARQAACVVLCGGAVVCVAWVGIPRPLLRALGLLRRSSARVQRVVDAACARTGITARATFEATLTSANALALPGTGTLVLTDAAVAVLDDEQLEAVCAHELAHLGMPRRQLQLRKVASLLVPVAVVAFRPLEALHPLAGAFACFAAAFATRALFLKTSIAEERRADAVATAHEHEEGVYARALERLYEANMVPAVLNGRQTHPHLYDRMVASGSPPDHPRPKPPRPAFPLLALGVATVLALSFGPRVVSFDGSLEAAARAAAMTAGRSDELLSLGRVFSLRGDREQALTVYRACVATTPSDIMCTYMLIQELLVLHRCEEAERALSETSPSSEIDAHMIAVLRRSVRRCNRAPQLPDPADPGGAEPGVPASLPAAP